MTTNTFTALGKTIKSSSKRRYAVVIEWEGYTFTSNYDGSTHVVKGGIEIDKRSDRPHVVVEALHGFSSHPRFIRGVAIDVTTGEQLAELAR